MTAGQVADRAALDAYRDALVFERAVWRDAVFASLTDGGWDVRHALSRLAPGGYLTVSIVPVLLAVALVSEYCRTRCLAFIDAQLALIGMNIEAALARRHADDRPATRELRGFAQALERARHAPRCRRPRPACARTPHASTRGSPTGPTSIRSPHNDGGQPHVPYNRRSFNRFRWSGHVRVDLHFRAGQYDDEFHRLDRQIADMARATPGYLGEETWENAESGLIQNVTTGSRRRRCSS